MSLTNHTAPGALPLHIGIIMDGNGRWAQNRNKPRTAGHREGLNAAKRIVKAAVEWGISYVTLYAFSTENWKRTKEEVSFLMHLIGQHLRGELEFYKENHIRVAHIGDMEGLPRSVQREIREIAVETAHFDGLTVHLAINYGGRDEIIRGFRRWLAQADEKTLENPGGFTEEDLASWLDQPETPDPDIIIRTGGEQRLSNFLLWQSAYTEFYYSPKLWPDWTEEDFRKAIASFQGRDRRFGGTT